MKKIERDHSRELRKKGYSMNEITRMLGVAEIESVSKTDLFFLGTAFYWGEGSKANRYTVDFTNSDPRAIQIMMRYFKEVCNVPHQKFRGHVILHPHLDAHRAEKYWSCLSGIPLAQFQKTSMQHNKASQNKKD